ncbi:MAG: hypothetical protein ABI238_00800 [Terrimesophilobacter sp.]
MLVRDTTRARSVLGDQVDVCAGDIRQLGLHDMMNDASVVISAVHGFLGGRGAGPSDIEQRGNANLIDAAPFMETWLSILTQTTGKTGRSVVFRRGNLPIAFISAADVAAVVCRAATAATLRGQVVHLAGEPVSMTQLAQAAQSARGWNENVRHVPRPMLNILATLSRPVNAGLARKSSAELKRANFERL